MTEDVSPDVSKAVTESFNADRKEFAVGIKMIKFSLKFLLFLLLELRAILSTVETE